MDTELYFRMNTAIYEFICIYTSNWILVLPYTQRISIEWNEVRSIMYGCGVCLLHHLHLLLKENVSDLKE